MRPVEVVALQERFNDWEEAALIFWSVFAPAEAFFPQGAIEALDMGLLVLL